MKKSILIIVILSIAALCFAGPLQEMHKRVIAGSTVAAGVYANSESCNSDGAALVGKLNDTELVPDTLPVSGVVSAAFLEAP
jgi:hypothetical protein